MAKKPSKSSKKTEAGRTTIQASTRFLSADERRAEGKAIRDTVPRVSHGAWKPAKNRRDPIEILEESNQGRILGLIPIRFGRMAQSPFTFYRGSAAVMAADLATTPKTGLIVQACGDAHLMNFGAFATPERNIIFDINDLDETLPAPWEWDVKRLAASVVIAGRHLRLLDSDIAKAAIDTVSSYREQMSNYASMRALEVWYDKIDVERVMKHFADGGVRERLEERVEREKEKSSPDILFPKLTEHLGSLPMIKDEPPLIYHPPPEQALGLKEGYSTGLARYRESLPEHVRVLLDRFQYRDLAIKVVGIGSVGTRCGIMLMMASDSDPLFLQIKEARPSVLEPYAGKSKHKQHGERVVAGQRLMQSASDMFLGWATGLDGSEFYVRQLRDTKISALIEDWDAKILRSYGQLCGWALARAHARSGDAGMIAGYMGSNSTFDDAVGEFAVEYADQNQRDYRAFIKAVREGRIKIQTET